MTDSSRQHIYVLETEPQVRALLETELPAATVSVSGFCGHQECLEELATGRCDLLVVDLDGRMRDGLNVLEQAKRIVHRIWSLAIVEHGAVPCAIDAIRVGADDCLDKPIQQDRLHAAVGTQLAKVDASTRRGSRALTQMEVQILQWILAGKTSCEMADELCRSKRTIDVHRKNIMRKLQATGLVDLIKRAREMGFSEQPERRLDKPGLPPRNDAVESVAVRAGPATGA
jgi:FixJ family two-component response regulator